MTTHQSETQRSKQHTKSARLPPHHRAHQKTAKAAYGSNTHGISPKRHWKDNGPQQHSKDAPCSFTYMPLTRTHTRQPDYIAHYLLQNNNKNPRRGNLAGNLPDSSGDTNNEDRQGVCKYHIYCLLPVLPYLAACITAPRQDPHSTTFNIVPNIYCILYPMLQHSQQTNH